MFFEIFYLLHVYPRFNNMFINLLLPSSACMELRGVNATGTELDRFVCIQTPDRKGVVGKD